MNVRRIAGIVLGVVLAWAVGAGGADKKTVKDIVERDGLVGVTGVLGAEDRRLWNGRVFFVDSADAHASDVDDGVHGFSWEYPYATLGYAVAQGTTNKGDRVLVAPTHAETLDTATDLVFSVAGVWVQGVGEGERRPTLTINGADATVINMDLDDCVLENVRIINGDAGAVTKMLVVTGDDCAIRRCYLSQTSDYNSTDVVVIGAADGDADRCVIEECEFYFPQAGQAHAIKLNKDMVGVTIRNNTIYGDFSTAVIGGQASSNAQVGLVVQDNLLKNLNSGEPLIEILDTGSTGIVTGNMFVNDGTANNMGGVMLMGNLGSTQGDSNVDAWTFDLGTNNLDHLMGTAVANGADLTTEVVDGTVLSNILTTGGDTSNYARASMSLQALASAIDTVDNYVDTEVAAIKLVTDDLAGISQIGDKVQVDMDANSVKLTAIKAVTDDLAGISQIGDKVQVDMDANSVLYWQPRVSETGADEVTQDLFAVAGGPIEILGMYALVTVNIGANATTCKVWCDSTTGAAYDVDFSTAVAIEGDTAGQRYVFTSANPSVLTPLANAAAGGTQFTKTWYCPAGMVEQEMSADPGGAAGDHLTWYMVWRPMAAGVTVTPQ
jgi:hypothetical protein